jgi:hypothetical protein
MSRLSLDRDLEHNLRTNPSLFWLQQKEPADGKIAKSCIIPLQPPNSKIARSRKTSTVCAMSSRKRKPVKPRQMSHGLLSLAEAMRLSDASCATTPASDEDSKSCDCSPATVKETPIGVDKPTASDEQPRTEEHLVYLAHDEAIIQNEERRLATDRRVLQLEYEITRLRDAARAVLSFFSGRAEEGDGAFGQALRALRRATED